MSQQLRRHTLRVDRFTLPDDDRIPTILLQLGQGGSVSCLVCLELGFPKLDVGFRIVRKCASSMSMPVTTMHKDDLVASRKHQIRRAGKISAMQPEAITEAMRNPSHRQLGLGVLSPYAAHHPGTRLLIDDVHESSESLQSAQPLPGRPPSEKQDQTTNPVSSEAVALRSPQTEQRMRGIHCPLVARADVRLQVDRV